MDTALRLPDVATFLAIARAGSLSGAARSLRVTPSQVSKALCRLEDLLGARLVSRSAHGIVLTDAGERALGRCERIVDDVRGLQSGRADEDSPVLTMVAASHLNALFVPAIVAALDGGSVRSLELPPGSASAYATGHAFDIALTTELERWPASWEHSDVGHLRNAGDVG